MTFTQTQTRGPRIPRSTRTALSRALEIPEPDEEQRAAVKPSYSRQASGLDPVFESKLDRLIAASGGKVYKRSGFRTYEQQAGLYAQAVAKYGEEEAGNWAAPPGESNHNHGLAVDLGFRDGGEAIAHELAPIYGLVFPMDHEPWHIEPAGVRTDPNTSRAAYTDPTTVDRRPSIAENLAHVMNGLMDNTPGTFGAAIAQMQAAAVPPPEGAQAAEAPADLLPQQTEGGLENPAVTQMPVAPSQLEVAVPEQEEAVPEPVAAGASGEGGDAESWIRQAMQITGVDESWYEGLYAQMMHESGGRNVPQGITDVNTAKGTPAFGPMQVIEPTFNSNKLPGYDNWKDPLHNTIAAIRYIQNRYGHVNKIPGLGKQGY